MGNVVWGQISKFPGLSQNSKKNKQKRCNVLPFKKGTIKFGIEGSKAAECESNPKDKGNTRLA